MFAQLPTAFPKLEALVRSMDAVQVSAPPPVEAIGRRLRSAYASARVDGYRSLGASDLRKLPFAYWLPPEQPLHEIHQPLVQRYWSQDLPTAIEAGPLRAKRWLMPLFFAYCENFAPSDEWFHDFARRVTWQVERGDGEVASKLRELQREVAFFNPQWVPQRLASSVLSDMGSLTYALESRLLWPTFVDTPLGMAAFGAALQSGAEALRDEKTVDRLLDWANRLSSGVAKSKFRVAFADALLTPWAGRTPPQALKARLVSYLVAAYGDPRFTGHRHYSWGDVSSRALSVILTWLAGDTLRGFMGVLQSTTDEIWPYRKKFWMAYYDAGHIQEAWLALGTRAAWYAKRLQVEARGMGYAHLESGATNDQSVLLLKIGQIVFVEWSHNGSLRAYRDDDPHSPSLYARSYQGSELRDAVSMDFHHGANQNPELRHQNSAGGTWQRKARDFIRWHTGIHMQDWDIT